LLEVARIESGLVQPRREWSDLHELLADAHRRAEIGDAEISFGAMSELPPILVDASLFSQALAILFRNATTHGSAPEPPVVNVQRDGDQIVITLADRGPGLPPGDEERVFMRFYRGSDVRPGGLGLGLAIARQLIEVHGGTLTAENRPAGGARFTVRLPIGGEMKLPVQE